AAACTCAPPSSSTLWMPSLARWRSADCRSSPGAPTTTTGPSLIVEKTRALAGVRRRRSKITRTNGRSRYTSRTVNQHRLRTDGDRVDLRPQVLDPAVGFHRGELRPHAGRPRDSPVEARRRLDDDEGTPFPHRREERLVEAERGLAFEAFVHLDAVRAECGKPAAAHERKRIPHRRDHPPDAGRDDALGAGTGASRVRTRLERAVQRRAARALAGLLQRVHLRMRFARALVRAVADDDAVIRDDAGADDGVR